MSSSDTLTHREKLAQLQRIADAALKTYDLPAGARATMINLSENATYRVDAGERNGPCGCTARAITRRPPSAPSSPGFRRCAGMAP
ncbi:hypothetical protein [Nordella sp. HKS 07]|uniref:hypothetical protein n=1 Tax=Nordella sp. HKS 07 TaxID=2712222 RepID=UPI001FF0541B|nr:hypothetical protein [Nordella sp. HKS 07]